MSVCIGNNNRIIDTDVAIEYIKTLRNDPKYYPGLVNDLLSMLDLDPRKPNSLREKKLAVSFIFLVRFFSLNLNI